ncbi:MAG: hypothetical protein IPI74_03445 [Bacteroidales bacterium]|nr:hypothetical protein [Bacteroidales bacterium]
MQRYLPTKFGYRYFSSPFIAATVSEFADDMNLASSFPLFYRYMESRTSSGWVAYNTGTALLNPMEGYSVNFGSVDLPGTVDVTGVVNNGAVNVTLQNHNHQFTKGFNLAGNPYPSPVNWNAAGGQRPILTTPSTSSGQAPPMSTAAPTAAMSTAYQATGLQTTSFPRCRVSLCTSQTALIL